MIKTLKLVTCALTYLVSHFRDGWMRID